MKLEIKVPAMGESITEATIGPILKPPGTLVKMDEELLELATDKVNQVLYAPQAGIFTLSVKEDQVVKIGQTIGFIDTEGVASAQPVKPLPAEPSPKKQAPSETAARPKQEPAQAVPPKPAQAPAAAPQAAKAPGARISAEDYLSGVIAGPRETPEVPEAIAVPRPHAAAPAQPGQARETRRKMSKIRKVIAARLVDVMQNTAMLTTFNEVDMTAIIGVREKYKEAFAKEHGARLGLMSFFVKASVSALKAFPDINSYIEGDDIVHREYYDIGIAVGTDRGLVVPVLRDCDRLSFAGIEQSVESFGKKARDGILSVDDLQGGGFTITNGGVYGSLLSTPILNPPQCAILGMHKIMKRAVVIDDQIVVRQMMYLALSYDHRIVDGKAAVSFLVHIKNYLEDPLRLVLEL